MAKRLVCLPSSLSLFIGNLLEAQFLEVVAVFISCIAIAIAIAISIGISGNLSAIKNH